MAKQQKFTLDKILIKETISTEQYEHVLQFVDWCYDFIQKQTLGGLYRNHIIYTIAIRLFKNAGIYNTERVKRTLKEYVHIPRYVSELDDMDIPDVPDILGITYQVLLQMDKGSGQTPDYGTENISPVISDYITKDIKLNPDETLLDPCCGSGMFLCSVKCDNPKQLYGIDIDITSCFITKVHLLLKYKHIDFIPNVYNYDFLITRKIKQKFDYIIVNAPYMEYEVFSAKSTKGRRKITYVPYQIPFLHKCNLLLKPNGKLTVIANTKFLTSGAYFKTRDLIMNNYTIYNAIQITGFEYFLNTYVVAIQAQKQIAPDNNAFTFTNYDIINNRCVSELTVNQESFKLSETYAFNFTNDNVSDIAKYILHKGEYTLKDSKFIIGIITSENRKYITNNLNKNHKPPKTHTAISTGKDIVPYKLLNPKSAILNSAIFSKCVRHADMSLYKTPERLVYRYVSAYPIVAYDTTQRMFLNSLYGLIPNIPNMSIKTVMAFMNSRVFEFLYRSLYGTNIIQKNKLLGFTFPVITSELDEYLTSQIDNILNTNDANKIRKYDSAIQQCIYDIYELTDEQINVIEKYIIQPKYTKTGTY